MSLQPLLHSTDHAPLLKDRLVDRNARRPIPIDLDERDARLGAAARASEFERDWIAVTSEEHHEVSGKEMPSSVTPAGIVEHYCEHPDCTAWGSFGFSRGKDQPSKWFCGEHRSAGERYIGRA
ncbi:hypothetical protein [Nitratireductor sp. GCM10026969]|uniref:hypothetical protein n=1 Tax=Nitratireductor sp. GCM10026969 TaxID=3252645 RepID=UPI00360B7F11